MDQKKLTLSLVIPVFNEERYLAACLNSVAEQTEPPDEVIVVDNNSTDRTAEIAKRYKFVTVMHEPNQGITFARNAGFDRAKSDIIGRIDADTHLSRDWVSQAKKLFTDDRITAATGICYFYDYPLRRTVHFLHTLVYYIVQRWIAGVNILWGSNMAIRRDVWQRVKQACDETDRGHEDVDLALSLKRASLTVTRSRALRAEVSMLRGDLGLRGLARYLDRWPRTYFINGLYARGALIYILAGLSWLVALITFPVSLYMAVRS